MVVVAVQPVGEQIAALLVGQVGGDVGPLGQQRPVVALGLAVDLRCVERRPQVAGSHLSQSVVELAGKPVVEGVVRHAALQADAVAGEEAGGPKQEGGTGRALLIGQDLAVGEAAVVVDHRVDKVVAQAPVVVRSLRPAMNSPTASVGDAAQLLHVHVDEFAGVLKLVATDQPSSRPIQPVQAVEGVAAQGLVDGGGRMAGGGGQPVRSQLALTAQGQDRCLSCGIELTGTAGGPARTNEGALPALLAVAPQPLVGRGPGDASRLGRGGRCPASEDAPHQELAAEVVETRSRMHAESPPTIWMCSPTVSEGSRPVNRVRGKYS